MKTMFLTIAMAAMILSGCGSDVTTGPETGMSVAEVREIFGSDGTEWPNLEGDSRQLIEFQVDGRTTMAAFEGGKFIAAKELPSI